jgi:hypothetical protein
MLTLLNKFFIIDTYNLTGSLKKGGQRGGGGGRICERNPVLVSTLSCPFETVSMSLKFYLKLIKTD